MISVCMATYNGEEYIKEQIDSILPQLGGYDELIISDDGSTDNTIEIISYYFEEDTRIKLYFNKKRKGIVGNFGNALNFANGDYVFLSDQDDVWLPNKVEVVVNYLQEYDCVVSDAFLIDANGNTLCDSFFKKNKSRKGFLQNFFRNRYLGCCLAFNRKILKHALPFPTNIPMHDIWIGLVAEIFGKSFFIDEPLIYYRRHGFNFSMTSEKSKNSLVVKLRYRIVLMANLIRRIFFL